MDDALAENLEQDRLDAEKAEAEDLKDQEAKWAAEEAAERAA